MDLPKDFENYLEKKRGVSKKTLKNYRSDLTHFLSWALRQVSPAQGKPLKSPHEIIPYFSASLLAAYKGHHLEEGTPHSTTNRRLSTLRSFAKFLHQKGLIPENPGRLINNVQKAPEAKELLEKMAADFEKHLKSEGISKTTLKNYRSDVRHFLSWLQGEARLIS